MLKSLEFRDENLCLIRTSLIQIKDVNNIEHETKLFLGLVDLNSLGFDIKKVKYCIVDNTKIDITGFFN